MSGCQSCKQEFQLSNFGLEYRDPGRFSRFEFGWPRLYIAWRVFVASYHVAMIILTGFVGLETWTRTPADEVKWFVYLTHWMFFLLTICTVIEAVAVFYTNIWRPDIVNGDAMSMPTYLRFTWVIQNIANNMSVLTSLLFWALLYSPGDQVADIDIITHAGNVIYVFINIFVTASPVRFYHFFHTFLVAVVYVIFTVIYYFAGGTNGLGYTSIYSVLDWSKPGTAAMYACITAFVGVPVIQLLLLMLYTLRVKLYSVCVSSRRGVDIQMKDVEKA